MSDLKIQHLLTLSYLISKGAKNNYVAITTSALGKNIKKSQQAASKHLLELEQDGFIERIMSGRKLSIKITREGYQELVKIQSLLRKTLETSSSDVHLKGTLVSGMGEGAYYMSLKGYTNQFKEKIGYIPFPGTLNVKLHQKEFIEAISQLDVSNGIKIDGFSDGKRTYGWVKCFDAQLNGSIKCHLIRLERTHHDPSIIELISKKNIRKEKKISNGSNLKIKIIMPSE